MARWLHDPRLRTTATHRLAQRASTVIGRSAALTRVIISLSAIGILVWCGSPRWALLGLIPLIGAVLAYLHSQEAIMELLAESRFLPARLLGQHLIDVSWRGRVSLPGVLEALGHIVLIIFAGWPDGPVSAYPDRIVLMASLALIYSGLGTFQVLTDSSLYRTDAEAFGVKQTLLLRALTPSVLSIGYAVLLNLGELGNASYIPLLAGGLLLLYPAVRAYEGILRAAELARLPALHEVRVQDAMSVHAEIGAPLHYANIATKHRPQEAAKMIIYLRNELDSCIRNLEQPGLPFQADDLVAGIRAYLPADQQGKLRVTSDLPLDQLGPTDTPVARGVLIDLCCNALKSGNGERWPNVEANIRSVVSDGRSLVEISVDDDGPGLPVGWIMGKSLQRLKRVLRNHGGDLTIDPKENGGVIATASWVPDPIAREV